MYQKLRDLAAGMVKPLEVNGLHGRVLTHPSRRRGGRTIVFVYGIHGSLERFYGVIHFLARFGTVVVPDLPGFGGMEPFYKMGKRPGLDAYGDYLAEFVEQELPSGKLTLVGLSYGFVVITRMLVRHPKLTGRVDLVVSAMGLADGRDLNLRWWVRGLCATVFAVGRWRATAVLVQYFATRRWVMKLSYRPSHPKIKGLSAAERADLIDFETYLWGCNDMQTYCASMAELFGLRQPGAKVALPVQHIATSEDHWLDIAAAERHIGAIFDPVVVHDSKLKHHGGVAYADEEEAREIIPPSVTQMLEAA